MKIEIESAIKVVKAVLKALIGTWSDEDRLAFFVAIQSVVVECISALGVVKDTKPSNRVERTIATVTEKPVVSSYQGGVDGRLAMIEGQITPPITVPKPITVSTVTKKVDGTVVRKDPETDVPKLKKRPFFPGMSANKNGLLSYMYYVNGRKVSYSIFTHEILRVLGASMSDKDRKKYTEWGYSVPKTMIRNGECKEWSRTIGGQSFSVKVDPKSLN